MLRSHIEGPRQVRTARSADLTDADWRALTSVCEAAFGEPWGTYWRDIGPAVHWMAEVGGRIAAHACLVERELQAGEHRLRTAYVEAVATVPEAQRRGHATALMRAINVRIRDAYRLGGLSTGSPAFYERLGWQAWRGPTFIRQPSGDLLRTADDDGGILILRTPSTPQDLDLTAPISAEWRPGELW